MVKSWEKTKEIKDLRVTLVEVAREDKKTYKLVSIRHLHFDVKPRATGSKSIPGWNKGSFYAAIACGGKKKGGEKLIVRLYDRIKDYPMGTTFNKAGRKAEPMDLSKRR